MSRIVEGGDWTRPEVRCHLCEDRHRPAARIGL